VKSICLALSLLCTCAGQAFSQDVHVANSQWDAYPAASAHLDRAAIAAPDIGTTAIQTVLDFVTQTNWYAVTYGLYGSALSKSKFGAGIGYFYSLTKYTVAGVRLEMIDGDFWMPDGSMTLQLPISIGQHVVITPLAFVGVGVPIAGAKVFNIQTPGHARDNNGNPSTIYGIGFATRLFGFSKWDISEVADIESWSGFPGVQFRFGLAFHHKHK
jgi:hypothetical protein